MFSNIQTDPALFDKIDQSDKIVVLGGMGSGKSTLTKVLKENFPNSKIINYDTLAKTITATILNSVQFEKFTNEQIFSDPNLLKQLEDLSHPETYSAAFELSEAAMKLGKKAIHEIPVLAESERNWGKWLTNPEQYFDLAIIVAAPVDKRIERVQNSTVLTSAEIESRIASQADDQLRKSAAEKVAREVVTLNNP